MHRLRSDDTSSITFQNIAFCIPMPSLSHSPAGARTPSDAGPARRVHPGSRRSPMMYLTGLPPDLAKVDFYLGIGYLGAQVNTNETKESRRFAQRSRPSDTDLFVRVRICRLTLIMIGEGGLYGLGSSLFSRSMRSVQHVPNDDPRMLLRLKCRWMAARLVETSDDHKLALQVLGAEEEEMG